MATVYVAYDLRHDRKVAVKVLRPELAAIIGGDRFLAEIRTTANLQHPHILPLHDSGEADGKVFYVMPFVEGQSLRTRLMHERQLPVDEAVRITREVASALDYAHRQGVVHRDIKPENILLHDGQALVADFGIALAVSRSDGGTRMTETGMSLGTPHYMAPEQAMGEREISPRADVYALGCVLYECLAGEPPFTGPTAQAIIARVMTEQPRGLQVQRRTIPAHIEAAVRTALEKLPADRFASAAAFGEALANPSYALSGAGLRNSPEGASAPAGRGWNPRSWSLPTYVFAAAMLAFAAVATWLATRKNSDAAAAPLPVVAFQVMDSVPGQTHPTVSVTGAIAWARPEGIYVRPPGATMPILLAGTERPMLHVLAFSPDGEWLVFAVGPAAPSPSARLTVRRIAASGGVPQTLTSDLSGHLGSRLLSATWGEDDNIYLGASDVPARIGSVLRVSASGGVVDTLLKVRAGVFPNTLLPGHRTLLFTQGGFTVDPRILALDLESRDTVLVLANAVSAHWSPTGHVIAARHDGTLLALPFDPAEVRALGSAIPVADSIVAEQARAYFSISRNGTLAYVRGASAVTGTGDLRLALVDLAGDTEYLPLPPTDHADGSFSPDGRRVAYIRRDHVWIYDLDLGTHRQLTHGGVAHHNPVWSPDGQRVAFRADRAGQTQGAVYAMRLDGDTTVALLGGERANPSEWLADNTLLFNTEPPAADMMRLRVDSALPPVPVLTADWAERAPRVSPDGKWIAYGSTEGGTLRVYIRSWPELSRKVVVSGTMLGTSYPIWSRDSRTLYVQEGAQLVAFNLVLRNGGMGVAGRRVVRENMEGPIASMHRDGRRILQFSRATPTDSGPTVTRRMIVVSNWHEILRARLSSGREAQP